MPPPYNARDLRRYMAGDAIERVRVKNQILSVIKMHGSQTAVDLATKLQVSPMAIRQHMQTLQDEQLVTYSKQLVVRLSFGN